MWTSYTELYPALELYDTSKQNNENYSQVQASLQQE